VVDAGKLGGEKMNCENTEFKKILSHQDELARLKDALTTLTLIFKE
jgi:hypothetical protein